MAYAIMSHHHQKLRFGTSNYSTTIISELVDPTTAVSVDLFSCLALSSSRFSTVYSCRKIKHFPYIPASEKSSLLLALEHLHLAYMSLQVLKRVLLSIHHSRGAKTFKHCKILKKLHQ